MNGLVGITLAAGLCDKFNGIRSIKGECDPSKDFGKSCEEKGDGCFEIGDPTYECDTEIAVCESDPLFNKYIEAVKLNTGPDEVGEEVPEVNEAHNNPAFCEEHSLAKVCCNASHQASSYCTELTNKYIDEDSKPTEVPEEPKPTEDAEDPKPAEDAEDLEPTEYPTEVPEEPKPAEDAEDLEPTEVPEDSKPAEDAEDPTEVPEDSKPTEVPVEKASDTLQEQLGGLVEWINGTETLIVPLYAFLF